MTHRQTTLARDLAPIYTLSLVVALFMAIASAIGLLWPSRLYPTAELQQTLVANDVVNLSIGVPALLGSMWLARRGRIMGLLFWPGALFYVFYNYIAYSFALPLNVGFLLSLLLLAMSGYTMVGLVALIDAEAMRQRLRGAMPERLGGGVLVGLGLLFLLRAVGVLAQAVAGQVLVAETELPVLVSDILTSPAWVVGGLYLWRREPLGYVAGLGLLFQATMLFIGLIGFLLLQPVLTTAPFQLADVVFVLMLSLVAVVPFALFCRGAASADVQ